MKLFERLLLLLFTKLLLSLINEPQITYNTSSSMMVTHLNSVHAHHLLNFDDQAGTIGLWVDCKSNFVRLLIIL